MSGIDMETQTNPTTCLSFVLARLARVVVSTHPSSKVLLRIRLVSTCDCYHQE